MIPIYVFTNDNHLHLLRGFFHLFNQYYDTLIVVTVVGYSEPEFDLPKNFVFHSLGPQQPKEKWSNSLIQFCNQLDYDYFIMMLEDYWLISHVDIYAPDDLLDFMSDDVLRIDLYRIEFPTDTDLILNDEWKGE